MLRAYQAAAVELSERTNCVVAWLEDAEAEAARLEAVAADQRGPLHGVPVSVKECYDVAGTASTAGMAAFARSAGTYLVRGCQQCAQSYVFLLGTRPPRTAPWCS